MSKIAVSEERYKELLAAERKLTALERHGVDNWEWYGDAMEGVEDEESTETIYGPEV